MSPWVTFAATTDEVSTTSCARPVSRDVGGYLFPELFPLLIVRRLRRARRSHADFPSLGATADAVGYRVAIADGGRPAHLAAGYLRGRRGHPITVTATVNGGPVARVWIVCPMLRDTESFFRVRTEVVASCIAPTTDLRIGSSSSTTPPVSTRRWPGSVSLQT